MASFTLNSFSMIVSSANNSSGVTAGGRGAEGQSAPLTLLTGKFLLTYREKRGKEKGKMGKKEGKSKKGRGKIENCTIWGFFCFCFFWGGLFSRFKTTEICFGSTKMGIFYRAKAFHAVKKSGKITLPPLKNIHLTPLNKSIVL